jgi:hypothetical protein
MRKIMQDRAIKDEDDLNIMGIKMRQVIVKDPREWRKTVLDAKSYNRL